MIWDIIEAKIEAGGFATAGQNMFREYMPPEIAKGVMMRSPLVGTNIDPYLPDYYKTNMQIIVRDTDPLAGETKAIAVMKALTIQGEEVYPANSERGNVTLKMFFPSKMPIMFPRMDGKTYEWSLNFEVIFVLKV